MKPQLGLIGYGAFGRLAGRHLAERFEVLAWDPALEAGNGEAEAPVRAVSLDEAAACPVVVLAVPVGVLPEVVAGIGPKLAPGALVVDVGSVKVGPARVMAEGLPEGVEVVGTHPLFGPQSAAGGVEGLRIAVCPVRGERAARRVAAFCRSAFGLKVFVVSPEDHDREAATVQGLTHLIARVLLAMEPLPSRMTTASFERLMQAVDMVRHDSPAVFRAIEHDNPYAAEVRERFFSLAEQARRDLDD